MSIKTAKDCFKENINLTGGAHRDPVSFNLYNGLNHLAAEVETIEHRLSRIENMLNQIANALNHLTR